MVQTVDFFTPIVDDAFTFGRIAAANALSDVYAMGGRPLTALAVAGFPKGLDIAILGKIFAGGLDTLQRCGVSLLGGHTVQDQEIKFGYAVTGEIDPERIWRNAGALAGDVLFLTKPLGTGIISTALKAGCAPEAALEAAIASMIRVNREPSEALLQLPKSAVHACTDITGFGLVGHACEVAAASGVTIEIDAAAVPLLEGVMGLVGGNVPGGGRTNAKHFGADVRVAAELAPDLIAVLHDPQTSGGLLVSAGDEHAAEVHAALIGVEPRTCRIGRVLPRQDRLLILR